MDSMDPFDRLPLILLRMQCVIDMDASDHEDVSVKRDLTDNLRGELIVTGIDLARLQRASKGPRESASGCSNHII